MNIRFGLSVDNEQADAGRDGRICLARPNSQAQTGTSGEKSFSPVQLTPTTKRIDTNTLLKVLPYHKSITTTCFCAL